MQSIWIFACRDLARLEHFVYENRYFCVRVAQPHAKIRFSRADAYVARAQKQKTEKKLKFQKKENLRSGHRRRSRLVVGVAALVDV